MEAASRGVLAHLASCYEAVYRVAGAAAPALVDEAAVVRAYEVARALGALSLAAREALGVGSVEPFEPVVEVLAGALEADPNGRLLIVVLSQVVGPRLLVSLRDARLALGDDPEAAALVEEAADALVAQLHALAGTLLASARFAAEERLGAPGPFDGTLAAAVRELAGTLDDAGMAESLGVSR